MKVLSVVGARPQFIKAAAVSGPLRQRAHEVLLHTGQHYDAAMSGRFFAELNLPAPDIHLGVGSGSHADQTARMLTGIEAAILRERPDRVLVYGDTNSTLAGALAAAKLGVPVIHVEAGLRSFNRAMPEEINRVITDTLASLLCCPSDHAAANLAAEGITRGVHVTGDVMRDVFKGALPRAAAALIEPLGIASGRYLLLTIHRAGNTASADRLARLLTTVAAAVPDVVVCPLHPRTRAALAASGSEVPSAIRVIEPVGYLQMLALERHARVIVTDSGGVQKEAYWLGVPCVTLRQETEWVETVEAGWNQLTGDDEVAIRGALAAPPPSRVRLPLYGDGCAGERIAELVTCR